MWRFIVALSALSALVYAKGTNPQSGDELVDTVLTNCVEMGCVKDNVLGYLNNILHIESKRSAKNIDASIFKRAAKILKTHEIRVKLPEILFDGTEVVYNPRSGLDIATKGTESRSILKKKLFLPILLLLKLKMKALMPILVAIIGIKALKALILSKLAIAIVLGFVIYQYLGKSGMGMPMSMAPAPAEPPMSLYGAPAPAPAPAPSTPSSYEPQWEPNPGGPYSRVWSPDNSNSNSNNNNAQNLAYSAYYPGAVSTSTTHP